MSKTLTLSNEQSSRYETWTLINVIYLLGVIIFGAYVRASGAGAGCGSHWPLCNGQVFLEEPSTKTLIEFSHRLTSGLSLILIFGLYAYSRKLFTWRTPTRWFAGMTVIFLCMEALLGAGLVLFEHVADNHSVYRGFSMSFHLVNTFILMAFALLSWETRNARKGLEPSNLSNREKILLLGALVATVFVAVSGAITALGDTLFPVASTREAWRRSMSSAEHTFIQLRVYHPFLAVGLGAFLSHMTRKVSKGLPHLVPLAQVITGVVLMQLTLGLLNVYLMAPIWLQLLHLGMAQLLWLTLVLFVWRRFTNPLGGRNV